MMDKEEAEELKEKLKLIPNDFPIDEETLDEIWN